MNSYKKYIFYSYSFTGINIMTGFILFPLILEQFGIKALGIFGTLFSIHALLDAGIGWLSSSFIYYMIKRIKLKKVFFTLSLKINFIYGLFSLIVFLLYGQIFQNFSLLTFLYFGLFSMFTFILASFYDSMIADLKQEKVAFYRFIQQTLFFSFSFSLLFILPNFNIKIEDFSWIIFSLLISILINFIFVILYNRKDLSLSVLFHKKIFYYILYHTGGKYFLNSLSTILLFQIDIILIAYLYGLESVGMYTIIWKIPSTLIMLGWRLSEPFSIIVAEQLKNKQKLRKLRKTFYLLEKKVFLISILFAIGYYLFGEWFLNYWIGKNNVPNISYMYIVSSLTIIVLVLQRFYLLTTYYSRHLIMMTIFQTIELLIKLLAIIFLFKFFDILTSIFVWGVVVLLELPLYRREALKVFNA